MALEVKSLDSAIEVRGRILHAFEAAELGPDDRQAWLTFLVVGAGPTGVEMAGQIAELARQTLPREYRVIDTRGAQVVLVEMGDKVLSAFPDPLPRRAARSLEQLGVTLMLGKQVVDVTDESVTVQDRGRIADRDPHQDGRVGGRGDRLHARVNARRRKRRERRSCRTCDRRAGPVVAGPARGPGARRHGRGPRSARPRDDLPGARAGGDAAGPVRGQARGRPARGGSASAPFRYHDKGMLATIGRDRAVAQVWKIRFSGVIAWVAWLLIHIYYLIGFANRLVVMTRWAYSYVTRGRSSRLITETAHQRRR